MTFAISLPDWPVVECRDMTARLWTRQWSALQFIIMRDRGEEALATLRQAILRRHQRAKFLKGVDKLGISRDLPPAVIAGTYHYLSNMIGGLRMQYAEENAKKVWVRYLPPSWSFPGPSICAIPSSAQRRMFAGWHPQNGKSLGCPRLGFVARSPGLIDRRRRPAEVQQIPLQARQSDGRQVAEVEYVGGFGSAQSQDSHERQLGEARRFGDPDAGVGSGERALRSPEVGTAGYQRSRIADGIPLGR